MDGELADGALDGLLEAAGAVDAVVGDGGAEGLEDVEGDRAEGGVELGAGGVGEEGVEAGLELGEVVGREEELGELLGDAQAAELDGLEDDVGEALLERGVAAGVLVEAGGEEALPGRREVAEVARAGRGRGWRRWRPGLGEEVVEEDELAADAPGRRRGRR